MSSKCKLVPILHRVLIKADKDKEGKVGRFIMPKDSSDQKLKGFSSGEIIDIGPLAFNFPDLENTVLPKIGDRVHFVKYAGVTLAEKGGYSVDNNEENEESQYRIVNDEDILAIEMTE